MTKEDSTITCVIPTYRRPESLRCAILSVLRQTYGSLKVTVFDNASGDATAEVVGELAEADPRVHYHLNRSNIGVEANFRIAIESVDTPLFSILSDDDLLAPEFYEKAAGILSENSDVMFVILDTLIIDIDKNLVQLQNAASDGTLTFYRGDLRFDALHSGVIPSWTGMVFRREVADIYKNMSHNNDIGHDHKFLIRAAARYNFAHLSCVGAFFTNHQGSISSIWEDFDLIRHYSKVSRYVEVAADEKVPEFIRHRARFYLNRLVSEKPYKQWALRALKRFVGRCCNDTGLSHQLVEADIRNSQREGYRLTSAVLAIAHRNRFITTLVVRIFGKYYINKKQDEKKRMLSLQNGDYRQLFDNIKGADEAIGGGVPH